MNNMNRRQQVSKDLSFFSANLLGHLISIKETAAETFFHCILIIFWRNSPHCSFNILTFPSLIFLQHSPFSPIFFILINKNCTPQIICQNTEHNAFVTLFHTLLLEYKRPKNRKYKCPKKIKYNDIMIR